MVIRVFVMQLHIYLIKIVQINSYVICGDSWSPVTEMKKRDFGNFGLVSFREGRFCYKIKMFFTHRCCCEIDLTLRKNLRVLRKIKRYCEQFEIQLSTKK